ncbi:DNA-3-methyladenine glycosylase I [Patescibacteria group bacterium]|nr:DNA-3-methyladenine glycosylase I [Patescibacteria group bacterium]
MKKQQKKKRCPWVKETDALLTRYHDTEWGVPVRTDKKMFEFLVLEVFQAGLSWNIVLRKRENFRRALSGFDFTTIARYADRDVQRLIADEGIIRNRAKILATMQNAKAFLMLKKEFGSFAKYLRSTIGDKQIIHRLHVAGDYPSTSDEAILLAKDLKKRGFSFLGPTVLYAHLQAIGAVHDHVVDCFRYKETLQ